MQRQNKILIILIIIVIVVISIVIAIILKEKPVVLKGTFEEKLKTCLEKNLERNECYLMYDDYDTIGVCENLTDLRDKCLYKIALTNEDKSLCEKINNEELKNKCDEEIIIPLFEE